MGCCGSSNIDPEIEKTTNMDEVVEVMKKKITDLAEEKKLIEASRRGTTQKLSSSETIREVTYWEHEIITVEPTERKPPQGKKESCTRVKE